MALGPRPHHLQQERHPVRSGKADGHLGHAARHAGRHHARLRHRRIPAGRRHDRPKCSTCCRRSGAEQDRRCGGDRCAARWSALVARFPDLSKADVASGMRASGMRCPSCGSLDTQVKDSRPTEDSAVDPAPPRLPRLQFPLHHLRARAVARTDGGQAQRPARAVRPRQADALGADRAAQAPGRSRARRADGVEDRARAGKHGRKRSLVRDDRRDW